jgi:hypothetical protein
MQKHCFHLLNDFFLLSTQNTCHLKEVLKRGHFVMMIHLIFVADVKDARKDTLFYAAYTSMVLQVVYLSLDSSLMPSCSHLFTVCH